MFGSGGASSCPLARAQHRHVRPPRPADAQVDPEPAQALLEVGDESGRVAHTGLLEHEHPDPRRLAIAPELEGGRPGGVGGAAQLGCDRRHLGQRA